MFIFNILSNIIAI